MAQKIVGKAIYLDMDGTIFDLFNVPNWLEKLESSDASPYIEARPIVDLSRLAAILDALQAKGFRTGIISWGSRNASPSYMAAIRTAKKQVISTIPHNFNECHITKYGKKKHTVCHINNGILVDDKEDICREWEESGGVTIRAYNDTWIDDLEKLV